MENLFRIFRIVCYLSCLLGLSAAYGQIDYYPHHVGDTWVYYVRNGVRDDTLTVQIATDSLDAAGASNLRYSLSMHWRNNALSDYWKEYQKVDKEGNVYFRIAPAWYKLQYKSDAQLGEKWWTGYDVDTAYIHQIGMGLVFEEMTMVKQIVHEAGTEGYGEYYANGIGLLMRTGSYAILGELYLLSAKIDGVIYGDATLITGIEEKETHAPLDFRLLQNYPNPFNGRTVIRYVLDRRMKVKISVFDVLGREVRVLFNGDQAQGAHTVPFDASSLPSGIYFYRIDANDHFSVKTMMLQK